MPRMRTLKPDAATSETLAEVPRAVRWTFGLLWTHCDDEGRCGWNPKLLKAALYPLDDDVTTDVLVMEIDALERIGAVCIYDVDGRQYIHVPSWHKHQHPNRKVASVLPPCPGGDGADHITQHPKPTARSTHAQRSEPTLPEQGDLTPVVVVVVGDGDVGGDGGAGTPEPPATAPQPPAPTVNQRAQQMATAYTDQVPLSKFPAILGIAKKAIQSGRYSDEQIRAALLRLAAEGRSVTVETLRIELDGQPPPGGRPPRDKFAEGLDLARRMQQQADHQPNQQPRRIGA